jgi:hypothetical protein
VKVTLTYDTTKPLKERCLVDFGSGQYVVSNFDFKFDYLNKDTLRVVEEVHIGARGSAKERKFRTQKVIESITETPSA